MIYYFNSEVFSYDKIKNLDLVDKCIVYFDLNAVDEFTADKGFGVMPQKPLLNLQKKLEKCVGLYNNEYQNMKRTMKASEFTERLEQESDSIPFDYWKIRESFFDFMNELLLHYEETILEHKVLTGENLSSKEAFDFEKFFKNKSSLKAKEFMQHFASTTLFSRFIECRIMPESDSQLQYYNYYDAISKLKDDNPKQDYLNNFMLAVESKAPLECPQIDTDQFSQMHTFSYNGIFPVLDEELYTPTRRILDGTEAVCLDDNLDFLNPLYIQKTVEEKWARVNLEILYTIWFVCLKVSFLKSVSQSASNLVNFAYNRFVDLETEKIPYNIEMVKSLAFLLGMFKEASKFDRICGKAKKCLDERNQHMAVLSEYIRGTQVPHTLLDPKAKRMKFSSEAKKNEYTSAQMESITVLAQSEDQRDTLIPVSSKSYFETNAFCSKCNTYIPEEIILARMLKERAKTTTVCPNQACNYEFEPIFKCIIMKEKGCNKPQEATKLQSPLRLYILLKEFLDSRKPQNLLKVETSGDLYWNIVFYMNFLNVPGFYFQEESDPHVLELGFSTIPLFSFDEKSGKKSGGFAHTTINNSGNNDSSSFGEVNNSVSPDKSMNTSNNKTLNTSNNKSAKSDQNPKFIFKKDL